MKKVLFIDRDGTLILEPPDEQVDSLDKLEFYPGVFQWLGRIAASGAFELVMVSNQDGLGTDRYPEGAFIQVQDKLLTALANEGIKFTQVFIDRSFEHENKPTRKPGIAMLGDFFSPVYDLPGSYVIGDRVSDVALARNLGAKGILLNPRSELTPDLETHCVLKAGTWGDICKFLMAKGRSVKHVRKSLETAITIELNLDGQAMANIQTGIGFFDHMLEQFARHGMFNLQVQAAGDLDVDEHHTIEDTAIALGEAFHAALAARRGIVRYGFTVPMDDALAQVAVDFGGRPWLVWDAIFRREKVGDMPTEMFAHFFKSFSDAAKCNLNIHAQGDNEHHMIEAIFKAFARAIRMAVNRDGTDLLPTTKGIL